MSKLHLYYSDSPILGHTHVATTRAMFQIRVPQIRTFILTTKSAERVCESAERVPSCQQKLCMIEANIFSDSRIDEVGGGGGWSGIKSIVQIYIFVYMYIYTYVNVECT